MSLESGRIPIPTSVIWTAGGHVIYHPDNSWSESSSTILCDGGCETTLTARTKGRRTALRTDASHSSRFMTRDRLTRRS